MSILSRLATSAVSRENKRLRARVSFWREQWRTADRHAGLARGQLTQQINVIKQLTADLSAIRAQVAAAHAELARLATSTPPEHTTDRDRP